MNKYTFTISALFTSVVEAKSLEEAEEKAIEEMDITSGWNYGIESLDEIEEDDEIEETEV